MSIPSKIRTTLRRRLRAWFKKHARDLPWRHDRTPYKVWVSEIMLQQTRVETVEPYYLRFLEAFPDIQTLAAASEEQVLKLWEGLGYYARARSLHRAAGELMRKGGKFPNTLQGWQALPGVGDYTAAAIASMACGLPAPCIDGNIRRVFARIFTVQDPVGSTEGEGHFRQIAKELMTKSSPGKFNEALMELGALICTPRSPRCDRCPVALNCQALEKGLVSALPVRVPRKPVPHRTVVTARILRRGRMLIGRRPSEGFLGGLWELPGGTVKTGESLEQALWRELREELGVVTKIGPSLRRVEHAYTHFTVSLHLFDVEVLQGDPEAVYHQALKWIFPSQLNRYPMPGGTRKLLATPFLNRPG